MKNRSKIIYFNVGHVIYGFHKGYKWL